MTAGTITPRLRRAATAAVVGALTLLVTSCVPPSTFPDGSVPQIAPLGANGVAFDGTDLWMCDIFGGQLLRIDPATGKILERIGPDLGITSPDDLVFAPDGSIIYTSPGTGVVGRIRRTGPVADRISVLAQMDVGVNPIALTPDGTAVVVGYGSGGVGRVDRIDLATGAVSIVTAGVPDLNGFSFGPDGALWAPVGGPLSAITGEGGVIRIDVEFGTVARLPLTFPNEPGVRGLRFPVAAKWTPDGRLLVAQGIGPGALYEVDAVTVESVRFSTVSSDFADNLVTLDDGRTFVSGFFTSLSVVDATGQSTPLPIGG